MRPVLSFTLPVLMLACHAALAAAAPGEATNNTTAPAALVLEETDVATLQSQLSGGKLTSHQLTQAYLERIAALDDAGPMLNAVIDINPDALKEADARDKERKAGKVRGPMHGIPVLLKDNIDVTPMVNSAGSLALANNYPRADAFLVRKLREAGAVVLGKTNLSEWANFRSTRSISGWSGRGGQTKNPYALDRNPCGSSSGTGTAISASLAAVGIGTETDGSIICPSSVAGLVGLKPTIGLVSRSGVIPIAASQDTAGPMTRTVADAAALLTAIAGYDKADSGAAGSGDRPKVDYLTHLKKDALRGARIGVLREKGGINPAVDRQFEQAVAAIKAAGATVVDAEIPSEGKWGEFEGEVLLYEFKDGVNKYLAGANAPVKTLADLIEFNKQHASAEMPYFDQEQFEQAQAKGSLEDPVYKNARDKAKRLAGAEGVDAALRGQNLDALIAVAMAPAWLTDVVLNDHGIGGGGYGVAAVAGTPSLTVPMGESFGLPFGIVFMGPAWSEARLIELGYAFEQITHARKAPRFLPTVDVKAFRVNDSK